MAICKECGKPSLKQYEFGGYWCSSCLAWFTTQEIEKAFSIEKEKEIVGVA